MKRSWGLSLGVVLSAAGWVACTEVPMQPGAGSSPVTHATNPGNSPTGGGDGGTMGGGSGDDLPDLRLDLPPSNVDGSCAGGALGCTDQIDILFVIDNSATMGDEQANLARNFPLLVRQLEQLTDASGRAVNPDIQIMVTTTDFQNPVCTADQPAGYVPANGGPISNTCLERQARFNSLIEGEPNQFAACQGACLDPAAAPAGAPFISFKIGQGDNIPDSVLPVDIDGDGVADSPVAQALACVGPQGIDGCGFESPLENMLQALNTGAAWNTGEQPFLRPDALLAIAIITDEADCSIRPAGPGETFLLSDPSRFLTHPDETQPRASSAVCWRAGVQCDGPDVDGVYSNCRAVDNGGLHPISRYIDYLTTTLRGGMQKEIVMLGILGVPPVTEHNTQAPFEPTAGGVRDVVYRDWQDTDILPSDAAEGVTAAEQNFNFGIGPGCTVDDPQTGFTGQAIPPVRIREVCESLNITDPTGAILPRCCIESICDDDYSDAIRCLTGIIQEAIVAPG